MAIIVQRRSTIFCFLGIHFGIALVDALELFITEGNFCAD
jgi:hypothetical protein